jgi:hypothetical protein
MNIPMATELAAWIGVIGRPGRWLARPEPPPAPRPYVHRSKAARKAARLAAQEIRP